jgi:hypothetical protein
VAFASRMASGTRGRGARSGFPSRDQREKNIEAPARGGIGLSLAHVAGSSLLCCG